MHFLTVEGAIDRGEAVAKRRCALELQRLGRGLHLFARCARERLVPPLQEEDTLVDRRAVLVLRRVADARRRAAFEMEEQARSPTGQRARRDGTTATLFSREDRQLARAIREQLLEQIERLVDRLRVRERSEVTRGPVAERARPEDARKVLAECDLHVRIGLVVLEADVVARLVLLDEARLEEVRLGDRACDRELDAFRPLDHADVANIQGRAEVRPDPVTQDVGFAHI